MIKVLEKLFCVEPTKLKVEVNIDNFKEDSFDKDLKEVDQTLTDSLEMNQFIECKAIKLYEAQLCTLLILSLIISREVIFVTFLATLQISLLSILFLLTGLVASYWCLRIENNGLPGKHRDPLLQEETTTISKERLRCLKAYILADYHNRVKLSINANNRKLVLLRLSLLNFCASIILIVYMLSTAFPTLPLPTSLLASLLLIFLIIELK